MVHRHPTFLASLRASLDALSKIYKMIHVRFFFKLIENIVS